MKKVDLTDLVRFCKAIEDTGHFKYDSDAYNFTLWIVRKAKRHHYLSEVYCGLLGTNESMEYAEKALTKLESNIQKKIEKINNQVFSLSIRKINVKFTGDPRGPTIKLFINDHELSPLGWIKGL